MSAHRHFLAWATSVVFLGSCGGSGLEHADRLQVGDDCQTNDQCASDHCDTTVAARIPGHTGLCCAGETCCLTPADCPDEFRSPSQCSGEGCQGTRRDATCLAFACGSETKDDDSGCNGLKDAALKCGAYAPVACTTSTDQQPACATRCTSKADCATGYFCDGSGACVPMVGAGKQCTPVAGSTQGNCSPGLKCDNGVCCDETAGSCCNTAADCPASYRAASTCSNKGSTTDCQGTAVEATCNSASVCGSQTVDDDSGCSSEVAHACGVYTSVKCSGDKVQQPPVCVTTCSKKTDCAPGFTCNATSNGACVPEAAAGQSCTAVSGSTAGTCGSGLKCDSGLCCSASAPGSCCTSSTTCANGLACSNFSCATACTVNTSSGCASSSTYCTNGSSCAAKKSAGAACTSASECSSNDCYANACCTPKTSCGSGCGYVSNGCGGTMYCGICPCPSGTSRKCGEDDRCYSASQQCP